MDRQKRCEHVILGMARRTSSGRAGSRACVMLLVAAGLIGMGMRGGVAADIHVGQVKYVANIEGGKAVLRNAKNQEVALPAGAGLTVAASSDGKGVQVTSTTGKVAIKFANGLSLSLAKPGDCVAAVESDNGLRAVITAVSGKIRGSFTWTKAEVEYGMMVEMEPGCTASFTKGSMTVACEAGIIVLIAPDGTKFIMDAGDAVKITAGAVPGTIDVTATAGNGIKVILPDGTETILEVGQTMTVSSGPISMQLRPSNPTSPQGGGGSGST